MGTNVPVQTPPSQFLTIWGIQNPVDNRYFASSANEFLKAHGFGHMYIETADAQRKHNTSNQFDLGGSYGPRMFKVLGSSVWWLAIPLALNRPLVKTWLLILEICLFMLYTRAFLVSLAASPGSWA